MNVSLYLSSVEQQSHQIISFCERQQAGYRELQGNLQQFIADKTLEGNVYTEAKNYFAQLYLPLIHGILLLTEKNVAANKQFPEEYKFCVDYCSLQSEELSDGIREWAERIEDLRIQQEKIRHSELNPLLKVFQLERVEILMELFYTAKKEMEDKLERLLSFHASSPQLFGDIKELEAIVCKEIERIKQLKKINNVSFQMSHVEKSFKKNIQKQKFTQNIENFQKIYNLIKPEQWSQKSFLDCIAVLAVKEKRLKAVLGWQTKEINAYLNELMTDFSSKSEKEILTSLLAERLNK
ncbi:hypothetical protein ACYSNR_04235 [Enterococcus sp. LJL128]